MNDWDENFLTDAVRLERLHQSCFRELTEQYGLAPGDVVVLLFLERFAPGQDTVTEIAQSRGTSKALVVRSVNRLQKRGLLVQRRDEADRRVVHLALSEAGADAAGRMRRRHSELRRQLRQGITEDELAQVRRIMEKMQCNLNALLEQTEGQVL